MAIPVRWVLSLADKAHSVSTIAAGVIVTLIGIQRAISVPVIQAVVKPSFVVI